MAIKVDAESLKQAMVDAKVTKVTLSLRVELDSGVVDEAEWDLEPESLRSSEHRPMNPLYRGGEMSPYAYEPVRGAHTIAISGTVKDKEVERETGLEPAT